MKRLFVTLSLMIVTMAVMAIPAKRGLWKTLTLSNGTEVRAQLVGDEHGHWMQAEDGTCYLQNNGVYEQVDRQIVTERRQARLNAKAAKRKAIYASTSDGLGQKGTMSRGAVPSIGEYTIPVVMVQFSDKQFKSTTTVEKMTRYYNEEGYHDETGSVGSVRDYFKAQSGGQFVPTFDVVGIVTLSNTSEYYGGNNEAGDDQGLDNLPGDVVAAAVSQLGADFSKYIVPAGDSYHNDGVPLLAMFYAGKGEATEAETTENAKLLWPCEWDDVEDPVGEGTYNGVHFNSFFIGNELLGNTLMGMSVFCHEFGHAMGLPDFYCTDYSYSKDDSFGLWSIMDSGAYVDDECRLPVGYNAYEKSYMGWLELKEFGNAEEVTLQSPLGTAENSAYIIRNSSSETFIFENRQPSTWYPEEFGEGVMVSRIAYSYNAWSNNTLNNTQSKKRACILTANGEKLYYSASNANLYGGSKKSIASLKTYSGSAKNIGINDIVKNGDGTITLKFGNVSGGGDDPVTPTGDYLFYESFNKCESTGGNDGSWNGNGVANGTFKPDNNGWTAGGNKAYGADQCAKFGTGDVKGSATTPTISLSGEAKLTFRAGAWNSANKDGEKLSLTVSGGTISPKSFTMTKGEFTDFEATITSNDGAITITFETEKGRFFLDEVLVVDPNATGITTTNSEAVTDNLYYDLQGRRVMNPTRGLYIVNGKKVILK